MPTPRRISLNDGLRSGDPILQKIADDMFNPNSKVYRTYVRETRAKDKLLRAENLKRRMSEQHNRRVRDCKNQKAGGLGMMFVGLVIMSIAFIGWQFIDIPEILLQGVDIELLEQYTDFDMNWNNFLFDIVWIILMFVGILRCLSGVYQYRTASRKLGLFSKQKRIHETSANELRSPESIRHNYKHTNEIGLKEKTNGDHLK